MQFTATILLIALPWLNPFSPGPTPSIPTWLFSWACAAALLLVYALPGRRVANGSWSANVAKAWLLAALLSVVIALLQYFGISEHFAPWVNMTRAGEAFANLRQRNQFATLTNIGLAALFWGVAGKPLQGRWRGEWQVVAVLAAVLLGTGNAASSSRTGALQLLVLVGAAVWWQWRQRQGDGRWHLRLAVVALASYAAASLALPLLAGLDPQATGILGRVHEKLDACFSRKTLWANISYLIAQKPWLGWGWGELDYAHFITLYPGERFCDLLDNAHNLPLHLAVELGLPFALVFCSLCVWWVVRAKPWAEVAPQRQMAWAVIAVIALHSLLEYPLWYGPFQIALLLCIGILWRTERKWPVAPVLQAVVAICLIAILGYAAWDYWRMSQLYLAPDQRASAYRDDTLAKLQASRLFRDQVRFAELSTTEVTTQNAEAMLVLSKKMLHFSPEPRVVEKLLQCATLLVRTDEVTYYAARFAAAFPADYARWLEASGSHKTP